MENMSSMADFNLAPDSAGGEIAKTGHVVIVDDDPVMRQMVARYFEEHRMPMSAVSNRAELSRHLTVMNPCLILLDLRLGQDDGLDVLREIRAHSDVPIIIMTGHRLDEIDRVLAKLASDHRKPNGRYVITPEMFCLDFVGTL
jgi:CheY-like chemotaxis protein